MNTHYVTIKIEAETEAEAQNFVNRSIMLGIAETTQKDDMTQIEKVWDELENDTETNWDDLMEHEPDDLKAKFTLTDDDAMVLWLNIQVLCDCRRKVDAFQPSRVGHVINEALHQSLDGWTVYQGMVINAFLGDVAWACWQIQEDERLAKERRDPEDRS